jgi:hypothetical protein
MNQRTVAPEHGAVTESDVEKGHYDILDLSQGWDSEMPPTSPCCPDLLPFEFVLFLCVKKSLTECRFECIDTMSIAVIGFSCCLSVGGYRAAGGQLPHGWEKCKELGEECVWSRGDGVVV